MVVHNEEKVIERALSSIHKIADEILVVHDGSCTDRTVEICRSFGAVVWERPFVGIAEPHRPWLYEQAKGEWIFQLDADEFLSHGLQQALPKLLERTDVAIYELVWPTWDGKKYITSGWPHKKALFRKDKITFLGLPQCEVLPKDRVVKLSYVLEHQPPYNNFSWKLFRTKWLKWARIHAAWIDKDPEEYTQYPADAPKLLPRYYAIKRLKLLLAAPLGAYQGLLSFLNGGYKNGFFGCKVSLMIAAYWFAVGVYV